MKLKTLSLVVAVLAVLSAAAYWMNRPPPAPAADPRVGKPIADPAVVAKAAQIRASDQGRSVLLVRQPDGTWKVPGYFGLTADFSKLTGLVNDLTGTKVDRLVSENPSVLERLEFHDTSIELLGDHGETLWSVTLGKTSDNGGRFLRFGDEPKAYLANLSTTVDSDPKNWADATLLNLKPEDIARVEIPFAPGPDVVVSRSKPTSDWTAASTPAGQRVKADTLSSLLYSLGSLRFSDTSDPKDPDAVAASGHLRTFRLTTFSGQTYTVALGRKPEEKKPKPPGKPAAGAAAASPDSDTVPAGPVFAFVSSSEPNAPVNALMRQRAFQVDEYTFTGLPQKPGELFEPIPAPAKAP
jgi:hypothetical protein